MDQIEAAEALIQTLNDEDIAHDVSLRDLIEAMHEHNLVFAAGNQRDTIAAMDKMDEAS